MPEQSAISPEILFVWLLPAPPTSVIRERALQILRDCQLPGEICVVVPQQHLHPGTLNPDPEPQTSDSTSVLRVLYVSADWGYGAIQKLFCRRAVRDGIERIATVRGDVLGDDNDQVSEVGQQIGRVIESPADLVSLVSGTVPPKQPNSDQRASGNALLARVYRRTLLTRIPFELNDDGNEFEDDLTRQQQHIQAAHEILTAPSHTSWPALPSGAGFSRWLADLRFRLHGLGIWCSLKYRDLTPARYRDKSDTLYSSHQLAIAEVAALKPKTLLDLGCGPGFVSRQCRRLGIHVHGVDMAHPLPDTVSEFTQCNLDQGPWPFDIWQYDVVLLLDVIEHLSAPEQFLLELRHSTDCHDGSANVRRSTRPCLILTTPNIAFATIRLGLLLGRFNYADRGILDMTHRRLFTRQSLCTAIRDSGYDIEAIRPVPAPFAAILPGRIGSLLNGLAALAARACPGWFAFQWLVKCRPRPGVGHLAVRSGNESTDDSNRADPANRHSRAGGNPVPQPGFTLAQE